MSVGSISMTVVLMLLLYEVRRTRPFESAAPPVGSPVAGQAWDAHRSTWHAHCSTRRAHPTAHGQHAPSPQTSPSFRFSESAQRCATGRASRAPSSPKSCHGARSERPELVGGVKSLPSAGRVRPRPSLASSPPGNGPRGKSRAGSVAICLVVGRQVRVARMGMGRPVIGRGPLKSSVRYVARSRTD